MLTFLLAAWGALVALQCLFLVLIWGIGPARFFRPSASGAPGARTGTAGPRVSLIVPLTGRTPEMEAALRSLMAQDHPGLETFLVTSGESDPARGLADELSRTHPSTRHILAGAATHCAQKNRNLLDGVAAAHPDTEVFVFGDANNLARPDLVGQLVAPILRGEAEFTTGYREIELLGYDPDAVAQRLIIWSIWQFHAMPVFTQPWGGAMAMSADAFRTHGVGKLWAASAVDDCSLAGLLARKGISVRHCPGAMLRTPVRAMRPDRMLDWFTRQLLYPKFYTRPAWLLMGLILLAALLLPGSSLFLATGGVLLGISSPTVTAMAFGHLCLPLTLGEVLRRRLCAACPPAVWWPGYMRTFVVVFAAYGRTFGATAIRWRGVRYELDDRGRVTHIDRRGSHRPDSGCAGAQQA
jgi:ceramide glucosyltransferase